MDTDIEKINFKAAANNLRYILRAELTEMARFNPPRYIQLQSAVATINRSGIDTEDMTDEEYELTYIASLLRILLGTVPNKLENQGAYHEKH